MASALPSHVVSQREAQTFSSPTYVPQPSRPGPDNPSFFANVPWTPVQSVPTSSNSEVARPRSDLAEPLETAQLFEMAEQVLDGVTANVVHPPVTDTGWITDEVRAFVETDQEHHHIATPDEVAETVVGLCADASHLVTGNVIRLR